MAETKNGIKEGGFLNEVLLAPVRYLLESGRSIGTDLTKAAQTMAVAELHADPWAGTKDVAIRFGDTITRETQTCARPVRKHQVLTVESLCSFLNRENWHGKQVVVFVSHDYITAVLDYTGYQSDRVTLKLLYAPEYKEFLALKNLDQMSFNRSLRTELRGCIDDKLLVQLSGIKIKKSRDEMLNINAFGISAGSGCNEVVVQWIQGGSEEQAKLSVDWKYEGRLLGCWDRKVQIPCVLDLNTEDALKISLIPVQMDLILHAHLEAIATHIQEQCGPNVSVYCGSE